MILDELKKELPAYQIKQITAEDYAALFALQQTNPTYFSKMQDHPVTFAESIAGTTELPPNTTREQKFYIGFYRGGNLEAIMDYIVGYPEPHTVWIGLFMVDGTKKRTGIGKTILRAFFAVLKQYGIARVRLAYIEGNEESHAFWNAMGFQAVSKATSKQEGRNDWDLVVMNVNV